MLTEISCDYSEQFGFPATWTVAYMASYFRNKYRWHIHLEPLFVRVRILHNRDIETSYDDFRVHYLKYELNMSCSPSLNGKYHLRKPTLNLRALPFFVSIRGSYMVDRQVASSHNFVHDHISFCIIIFSLKNAVSCMYGTWGAKHAGIGNT